MRHNSTFLVLTAFTACLICATATSAGKASLGYRGFLVICEKKHALVDHLTAALPGVGSRARCLARCFSVPACRSINYAAGRKECHLSDSLRETATDEKYTESDEFDYCGPEKGNEWATTFGTLELLAQSTSFPVTTGTIVEAPAATVNAPTTEALSTSFPVTTGTIVEAPATTVNDAPTTEALSTSFPVTTGNIVEAPATTVNAPTTEAQSTSFPVTTGTIVEAPATTVNAPTTEALSTSFPVTTGTIVEAPATTVNDAPTTEVEDTATSAAITAPMTTTAITTLKSTTAGLTAPDCNTLAQYGRPSGPYVIYPSAAGLDSLKVYCDISRDEGGWIVIQRRQDGSVDFNQNWATYQAGFGDVESEFWLGNANIQKLTSQGAWRLRIELWDWDRGTGWAEYDSFSLNGKKYELILGSFDGNIGDSLSYHANYGFSTIDKDNDGVQEPHMTSCAERYSSGWWFVDCTMSNLNGVYFSGASAVEQHQGLQWATWNGDHYSMKESVMKIQMI